MDNRNMDRALDIVSKLMTGEEIHQKNGSSTALYQEYMENSEVYDLVKTILKKLNLSIYEYNDGLYVTAGDSNRVFGYSNEELRKTLGVRLNRELYLCYFVIFELVTLFYRDSGTYTYLEYVKLEDIIHAVDGALAHVTDQMEVLVQDELEENSFRTLAMLWGDMPIATAEEGGIVRAARNSKTGYVKMVLNFLISQGLILEAEDRYYPTGRMKALTENYFEEYKGRLYEIMSGRKEETEDAPY